MDNEEVLTEFRTAIITELGNERYQRERARAAFAQRERELLESNNRLVAERRQSLRAMVRSFHAKFGVEMPETPTMQGDAVCELRDALIAEELNEFRAAYRSGDLVAIADALADLAFVVEGAFSVFGIDSGPVLEEVTRSNLSKDG